MRGGRVARLAACVAVLAIASSAAAQDCYLQLSGADLHLVRRDGVMLTIGGVEETIPVDGVRLPPGPYLPDTLYNVYAVAGMVLEASTVPYVISPVSGLPEMAGDPTRALVGRAFTGHEGQWIDDDWRIYVLSYYHRREKVAHVYLQQNYTVTTWDVWEVVDGLIAVFVTWPDEAVRIDFSGYARNDLGFASITNLLVKGSKMNVASAFWGNWKDIGDYPVNLNFAGYFTDPTYYDVRVIGTNVGPQATTYGGGPAHQGLMSALFVVVKG